MALYSAALDTVIAQAKHPVAEGFVASAIAILTAVLNGRARLLGVTGPSPSGKTTLISTVGRTLAQVQRRDSLGNADEPCLFLYPNACTADEFLGSTVSGQAQASLMERMLQRFCGGKPDALFKIVVLDGTPEPWWREFLLPLARGATTLTFRSGSTFAIPPNTVFFVECEAYESPVGIAFHQELPWTVLPRLEDMRWTLRLSEWCHGFVAQNYPELGSFVVKELTLWADRMFPGAFQVLASAAPSAGASTALVLVNLFLCLFEGLLVEFAAALASLDASAKEKLGRVLVFWAFTWTFAASSADGEGLRRIEAYIRKTAAIALPALVLPPTGSVFDWRIDAPRLELSASSGYSLAQSQQQAPPYAAYVYSPYTRNLSHVLRLLRSRNASVALFGTPGSGKTSFLTAALSESAGLPPHVVSVLPDMPVSVFRQLLVLNPRLDPSRHAWTLSTTFATETAHSQGPVLLIDDCQLLFERESHRISDAVRERLTTNHILDVSRHSAVWCGRAMLVLCGSDDAMFASGGRLGSRVFKVNFNPPDDEATLAQMYAALMPRWIAFPDDLDAVLPKLVAAIPAILAKTMAAASQQGITINVAGTEVPLSAVHRFDAIRALAARAVPEREWILQAPTSEALKFTAHMLVYETAAVLLDATCQQDAIQRVLALIGSALLDLVPAFPEPALQDVMHQVAVARSSCTGLLWRAETRQGSKLQPRQSFSVNPSAARSSIVTSVEDFTRLVAPRISDKFYSRIHVTDEFFAAFAQLSRCMQFPSTRRHVALVCRSSRYRGTLVECLSEFNNWPLHQVRSEAPAAIIACANAAFADAATSDKPVILALHLNNASVDATVSNLVSALLQSSISAEALEIIDELKSATRASAHPLSLFPAFTLSETARRNLRIILSLTVADGIDPASCLLDARLPRDTHPAELGRVADQRRIRCTGEVHGQAAAQAHAPQRPAGSIRAAGHCGPVLGAFGTAAGQAALCRPGCSWRRRRHAVLSVYGCI